MTNIELAKAAVNEAGLLAGSEGGLDEIRDAIRVAQKALDDEPLTQEDIDGLHPTVAHRLRNKGVIA